MDWIGDCLNYLHEREATVIEADLDAQDTWVEHGNEIAAGTLRCTCSSWYLGANVPGKHRVLMP